MKIRIFVFLLITLCLRVTYAQNDCPADFVAPSTERIQELQKSAKDRGFLWKVTKDGKVSHLYGTVHVAKFEWIFPGPKLITALSQSHKLALELNLGDPETLAAMADLMSSKDSPSISNELNQRIKRLSISNCLNADSLERIRPEIQVMTLAVMSMKKQGVDPGFAIDIALLEIAKAMKKKIVGLETPKEQMDAIFSKPTDLEKDISDALKKLENDTDKLALVKAVNAWAESDFKVLDSYAEWCNCMDTPKDRNDMKRMVDDRNLVMSRRFDVMHADEGQIFLAIGALHMVGPMGLPSLLKNLGYSVERLN